MSKSKQTTMEKWLTELFNKLGPTHSASAHNRVSVGEACIAHAQRMMPVNNTFNAQLMSAIESDERISAIFALYIPYRCFDGDTLSLNPIHNAKADVYTTFLPELSEDAVRNKTSIAGDHTATPGSSKPGSTSNVRYVPGDPRNIKLPQEQLANLVPFFVSLASINAKHHTALGEGVVEEMIREYRKWDQQILKCFDEDSGVTVSSLMEECPARIPPWCPFIIETVEKDLSLVSAVKPFLNEPSVAGYRLWLFMNKALGDNVQTLVSQFMQELSNRIIFHHAINNKLIDLKRTSIEKILPKADGSLRGGRPAAANIHDMTASAVDPIQERIQMLISSCRNPQRVPEVLAAESIKDWEVPLFECVYPSPSRSTVGSSPYYNLASLMKVVILQGDVISIPLAAKKATTSSSSSSNLRKSRNGLDKEADRMDTDEGLVPRPKSTTAATTTTTTKKRFAIDSSLLGNNNRLVDPNETARPPSNNSQTSSDANATTSAINTKTRNLDDYKAQERLLQSILKRRNVRGVPAQTFETSLFMGTTDLAPYQRIQQSPMLETDVLHIKNVLHPFTSFGCLPTTDAYATQFNPIAYFPKLLNGVSRPGMTLEQRMAANKRELEGMLNTPPYQFDPNGKGAHARWHTTSGSNRMSYAMMVNNIPKSCEKDYADIHKYFGGFPASVVERGSLHLVLPSVQPWEFPMLAHPAAIESLPSSRYTVAVLRQLPIEEEASNELVLEEIREESPMLFASVYFTALMSCEAVANDQRKYGLATDYPIPVMSTVTFAAQRIKDRQLDQVSFPESGSLSKIFNALRVFYSKRVECARFNIVHGRRIATRIAYECDMPYVRTGTTHSTEDSSNADENQETFYRGMDCTTNAGNLGDSKIKLIDEMCGSTSGKLFNHGTRPLDELYRDYGDDSNLNEDRLQTPLRTAVHKMLKLSLEKINLRTLLYTIDVPATDRPPRYPDSPIVGLKDTRPPPSRSLPMSVVIAAIYRDFNRRPTSDKWCQVETGLYNNLDPFGELLVHTMKTIISTYKIYSAAHAYLIATLCIMTAANYTRSTNCSRLHMFMFGDTGTSKSFIYSIIERIAIPGVIQKSTSRSSKADTLHINQRGYIFIYEEAPPFIFTKPDSSSSSTKDIEQLEKMKVLTDNGKLSHEVLHFFTSPDGTDITRERIIFYNLAEGVFLIAANRKESQIQPAMIQRTLSFDTHTNKSSDKGIIGSQLQDWSWHNIDSHDGLDYIEPRVRQYYYTILMQLCYMNPTYEPQVTDAIYLASEVFRQASSGPNVKKLTVRFTGQIGIAIKMATYMHSVAMALRDNINNATKYAPCGAGVEPIAYRHLSTTEFFAKVMPHMFAGKFIVIFVMTLFQNIFENPVKSAIFEHYARKAYSKGLEDAPFKKIERDEAAGTPESFDLNYIVIKTKHRSLAKLHEDLARQTFPGQTRWFSSPQINTAISNMQGERFSITPADDFNNGETLAAKIPAGELPEEIWYAPGTPPDAPPPPPPQQQRQQQPAAIPPRAPQPQLVPQSPPQAPGPSPAQDAEDEGVNQVNRILQANPHLKKAGEQYMRGPSGLPPSQTNAPTVNEAGGAPANNDPNPQQAPAMTRKERLHQYFRTKTLVPAQTNTIQAEIFNIVFTEKGTINIEIPHLLLTTYWKDADTNSNNPFEYSRVWTAMKKILESDCLEVYTEYINEAVRENKDKLYTPSGIEYFQGKEFTYMTGMPDSVDSYAAPYLAAAKREVDAEVQQMNEGKPSKISPKIPTQLQPKWLVPVTLKRKENVVMALPQLLEDQPIDKHGYDPDDDTETGKKSSLVHCDPLAQGNKKIYKYDLDCEAFLQRCRQISIDPRSNFNIMAMMCRIQLADRGYVYPDTNIKRSVSAIKKGELTTAREIHRKMLKQNKEHGLDQMDLDDY